MRKVKIASWKAKVPRFDKEGKLVGVQDTEESLLTAIESIIANTNPMELPRGIEKFRIFNRVGRAFDEAIKSNELVLEEGDYEFVKKLIERGIPAHWGMNVNIAESIENFMTVEEE